MHPSADEIRQIFFAAMRAGYTGGATKTSILGFPGSKVIVFEQEEWLVKDIYFVHPNSNFSSGMTVIFCGGKLVWTMQYQGWYDKSVIPFLKRALAINYNKSEWLGGRGPVDFDESHLTYRNEIRGDHSFAVFRGHEEIHDNTNGRGLGYHDYQGLVY